MVEEESEMLKIFIFNNSIEKYLQVFTGNQVRWRRKNKHPLDVIAKDEPSFHNR